MAYINGSSIPFKKGNGAQQTCPRCEGEGTCPSFKGQMFEGFVLYNGTIAPACEFCGGRGVVSKKKVKQYNEEEW